MRSKVLDEITYPFPNFNAASIGDWEWMSNFISHYDVCNYLSVLGFELIHGEHR